MSRIEAVSAVCVVMPMGRAAWSPVARRRAYAALPHPLASYHAVIASSGSPIWTAFPQCGVGCRVARCDTLRERPQRGCPTTRQDVCKR